LAFSEKRIYQQILSSNRSDLAKEYNNIDWVYSKEIPFYERVIEIEKHLLSDDHIL